MSFIQKTSLEGTMKVLFTLTLIVECNGVCTPKKLLCYQSYIQGAPNSHFSTFKTSKWVANGIFLYSKQEKTIKKNSPKILEY